MTRSTVAPVPVLRFLTPVTALLGPLLGFAAACEATHPPEINAETVTTMKITPQGAEIEASLDVYNPNKNALTTSSFDSKVTIGGKPDVARAIVAEPLVLPGGQRQRVKLPIRVEWTDPATIRALAEAKQPAPYSVAGAVHFSGEKATVQTPFKINGTMRPEELAQAAGLAAAAPKASASASAAGSSSAKPPR